MSLRLFKISKRLLRRSVIIAHTLVCLKCGVLKIWNFGKFCHFLKHFSPSFQFVGDFEIFHKTKRNLIFFTEIQPRRIVCQKIFKGIIRLNSSGKYIRTTVLSEVHFNPQLCPNLIVLTFGYHIAHVTSV